MYVCLSKLPLLYYYRVMLESLVVPVVLDVLAILVPMVILDMLDQLVPMELL